MAGVVAFHRLTLCVLALLSLEGKGKALVVELTRGDCLFTVLRITKEFVQAAPCGVSATLLNCYHLPPTDSSAEIFPWPMCL